MAPNRPEARQAIAAIRAEWATEDAQDSMEGVSGDNIFDYIRTTRHAREGAEATALLRLQWSERLAEADDVSLGLTALRSLLRDAAASRAGSPPERL